MDYVTADPSKMDSLLQLHSDLIVQSIFDTIRRYPCLANQTVRVYIERNTSHAHAAFIAKSLEAQFHNTNIHLIVEKEFSKDGREKVGIWTKNKSNLIHVSQLLLDMNLVSVAENVVSIFASIEGTDDGNKMPLRDSTQRTTNDIKDILRLQLADFRRVVQVNGKQNLTGKMKNNNDDLAMAFILWLAWSCYLSTNTLSMT